ncbi:MAG TPA: FAD-dependent oxidoreductase [Sphingomicrobium sp.]|nr:FAD-dependent oxidoreductase [Sphingomicrobium sp.]
MTVDFDVLIVGGGIAGASLGAALAGKVRTAIVEAESHCGLHSTGRSAAFWLESYGGAAVAPLTAASRDFLADNGFLRPRGALHLGLDDWPELSATIETRRVGREELELLLPGIRPKWRFALFEPGCADIDVAGLHALYLRDFRRVGGELRTDSRLVSARRRAGAWAAALADGSAVTAAILVNAAGAWADRVASACGVQPIGISPMRRTMVQLRVGRTGLRDLPLVDDPAGTFYFKGETNSSIWLSPHDEIPSDPCDAAPEELDIAIAIDRFESVVDWPVEAVERSWAGLRSFAPDRAPAYGFDAREPYFFWCAGQGGFGIQTAPGASRLAAALLLGEAPWLDPAPYLASRFG